MSTTAIRRIALAGLLLPSLIACSSSGSPGASGTAAPSSAGSTEAPASAGTALTVTGVEYAYQGVPERVPAGTKVTFVNAGNEVHQIVAVRRNAGVTASLNELLAMPDAESEKLVTFLNASLAAPGETASDRITLDEPGSYIFICFIPVGTTELPSLAPGATPNEGLMPEGPPHFVEGMVAEFEVSPDASADGSRTAETAPSPSAEASNSPVADTFESTRHGYRVETPAGWAVNEYDGSWETLAQFTPGGEIPGEDAIAPRDFRSFLVMNSMAIPAGMTDVEWRSAFESIVAAALPADCSTTSRAGTFAGEPATIVEQVCPGARIVGRTLVHEDRGYYFTTLSPHPDPAAEAIVERMAASIEFND